MNYFSIRNKEGSNTDPLKTQSVAGLRSTRLFHGVAAIACAFAVGFLAQNAAAADATATASPAKTQAPIAINLKQFKVVKDDHGDMKFVDATAVLPGDVIEYRAVYSNHGGSALPVVATLPIPDSLEYVKDSASADIPLAHTVALKDSQFSKEPLVQKIVTAGGATVSQPLPYASYRYVRWDLGNLSPGKSVEVSVRAKVAQNPVVDASAEGKSPLVASSLLIKK